ncbi:hypothetical protein ACQ86N_02755 [Puia sp. P3]|uniref:hypothetical protein n=1 Tax=Puia sp. P3 TaxID=3423952 RepID=UPI003D677369
MRSLDSLNGREALIVYVKGNNSEEPMEQREVEFFTTRRATVKGARADKQTELVHFSLELAEFINCDVVFPVEQFAKPPYQFVCEAQVTTIVSTNWHSKIEQLVSFDDTLCGHLFYYFEIKQLVGGESYAVDPGFDSHDDASYFSVREGESYQLDLSIYISESNAADFEKYECKLEYDQKDFLISNPSSIVIGTEKDNRRYKLVTKSIDGVQSFDYLKILAQKTDGTVVTPFYETIVRFYIRKSRRRAVLFVLLILVNLVGTTFVANSKDSTGFLIGNIAIGLFLVVSSALGLYYYFNKRS